MDEDLIDLYWPDPSPSSRKASEVTEQFEEQASSGHSLPSPSKEGSDWSNLLKRRSEHMEKELLLKMQQITFQKELIKLDLDQAQLSMEIAKSKREAVEAELMEKYGEVPVAIDKVTPCISSKLEETGALGKTLGLPNTSDKAIGSTEISVNFSPLSYSNGSTCIQVAGQSLDKPNSHFVSSKSRSGSSHGEFNLCQPVDPLNAATSPYGWSQSRSGPQADQYFVPPKSQNTGNCTFTRPSYCYDAKEVKTEGEHNIVNQVKGSSTVREPQPYVFTRHDASVTRSYPYSLPMDSKFTPSRQIKKFSGESLDYHRFMVDFDYHVDCRTSDFAVKLGYLIDLCIGRAYDAIDHCGRMLPAQKGYQCARKLLKSRFGQEMQVVNAHLEALGSGPPLRKGDVDGIFKLSNEMSSAYFTLKSLGYENRLNETESFTKVYQRLTRNMREEFHEAFRAKQRDGHRPKFKDLQKFIEEYAVDAETTTGRLNQLFNDTKSTLAKNSTTRSYSRMVHSTQVTSSFNKSSDHNKCPVCSENHQLWSCTDFLGKPVKERLSIASSARLCFNCLKSKSHIAKDCPSQGRCKVNDCRRRLNSLLHYDSNLPTQSPTKEDCETASIKTIVTSTVQTACKARLKVVPVEVASCSNKTTRTYAFLDDGSNATLCSTRLMRKLGIQGKREKMQISTVFGEKTQTVYKLDLKVKGLKEAKQFQLKDVYALPSLPDVSGDLVKEGELQNWTHLEDIDIPTLDNLHVDLLIGADNIQCLLVNETRVGKDEQPMGIHTGLGWALSGGIRSGDGGSASVNFTSIGNQLIHNQLERMFSLDFCGEKYTDESDLAHSVDDVRDLSKMKSSTKMIDGHYEVALPWRNDRPLLPNNRKLASKRLECLKRKLEKDSELFEKYKDKIDEYLNFGYAKQVPENLQNPQVGEAWYIPHHATMQSKFRVVFDCAARFNNTSLNEQLLKGPDFTNNLVGVLIRFRQDQYAFTCDIKSMFHQINVSPFDSNYLRFLWWPNHDLNCTPVDYQMTVHRFGATSSPSVAGYALRKVAEDNSTDADQIVIKTVQRNFYVDDCLKSMSDIDSTINLIEQLRALLLSGGFFLTKFTSNCCKILFSVPGPDRAVANDVDIMCNELPIGNTLGLVWIPEIDAIKIKVHVKEKPITRRGILSVISQVYDPLGIVQPFILTMKRHLQSLNGENLDWDEPLSLEMQTEWNNWLAALPSLEKLSVPCCYNPSGFIRTRIELHCFSDGSQNGFGAVAYLRMTSSSGEVHCSFVLGKSRVAPRKPMTVPRLELTAAVVAVRLAKFIQRNCNKGKLLRAKVGDQLEAQLPECRVTPNHPSFYRCGIDYMSPVMIKQGRNILKRYIAVFTCLASRAVHLEVSNSLDTSSFLMTFHRFAARRGRPSVIFSDNGTNFVGAERELKDALKSWDKTVLQEVMLKQQMKWHFNPPAASHQGGVWERVIRTIRKVLSALTMDRILNDETLHSFIVEVEQIINSRPITPVSSDPADDLPLTPKILLIGRLQSDLPPGQFIRADGYRKSWKLVQFLADQFWSQWLKLYIPCLQARHKWFKQKRNLAVGDVVLIADDNTKRSCWPKAVVEETFPDKDGLVRRSRLRTACSSLTRDIRKLCLLEGLS